MSTKVLTEQSSAAKLPEIRVKNNHTEPSARDKKGAKTFQSKRQSMVNVKPSPKNRLTVDKISREPEFSFNVLTGIQRAQIIQKIYTVSTDMPTKP